MASSAVISVISHASYKISTYAGSATTTPMIRRRTRECSCISVSMQLHRGELLRLLADPSPCVVVGRVSRQQCMFMWVLAQLYVGIARGEKRICVSSNSRKPSKIVHSKVKYPALRQSALTCQTLKNLSFQKKLSALSFWFLVNPVVETSILDSLFC